MELFRLKISQGLIHTSEIDYTNRNINPNKVFLQAKNKSQNCEHRKRDKTNIAIFIKQLENP